MKLENTIHSYRRLWYGIAAARIALGFIFLWAFLDKLFGLGIGTRQEMSWLSGGSPTSGFLSATDGYFAHIFQSLAGNTYVDVLFMIGLLGLGVSLLLGIGLRIAAVTGTILLLLMWAAQLPLSNNPCIDEHIIYILLLWISASSHRVLSLSHYWLQIAVVKRNPWLW